MKKRVKQNGIGLLELMLSLAIIAVLIISATRYYLTARSADLVEDGIELLTAFYSAGQSWLQSHDDFSGVSVGSFIADNSVPSDSSTNPWGGLVTATQGGTPTTLHVEFQNIPAGDCENLRYKISQKITNATAQCGGGDPTLFEVDFELQ